MESNKTTLFKLKTKAREIDLQISTWVILIFNFLVGILLCGWAGLWIAHLLKNAYLQWFK
jgi:hypothetical protein